MQTEEFLLAKAEAYLEAAEHLLQSWTDDRIEMLAGNIVSAELRKRADTCETKAKKLRKNKARSK